MTDMAKPPKARMLAGGYKTDQVDAWLADAYERLDRHDGSLTAADCNAAVFDVTLLGGYRIKAVDDLLEDLARQAAHDDPATPADYGFRPFTVEPRYMTDAELAASAALLDAERKRRESEENA